MENIGLPKELSGVHIHFVGIKGTGMVALVEILHNKGAVITGSDVSERFYTDEILEKLGLKALPFDSKNITSKVQYVVYSSAYKLDKNPDLIEATKKNIPCILYTQALGSYSSRAYSCGICGVHGKTSTTGIVGTILKYIDLPVQVLAGSVINSFGNTCTYTSPLIRDSKNSLENIFIAETCEYQRHFMSFCPKKIVLTSVEPDHQDFYPTYEDIRNAFVDYICLLPFGGDLIFCADDKGALETANIAKQKRPDINLIPYGQNATGDFKLTFGKVESEKNNFSINFFEKESENKSSQETSFALSVPGKHEVLDACAAVALVCQLLKEKNLNSLNYYSAISKGLLAFSGGKRRSEVVGRAKNSFGDDILVIDDYGHHPTAVKTTLAGYKEFYKGRKLIVDFMSHTYSRTQALLTDFASCFDSADEVILHKIYSSARENPKDFTITGKTLFEQVLKNYPNGKKIVYYEDVLDATDFVLSELKQKKSEKYPDGYLFVTMGAGDNWKLGIEILKKMKK